MRIIEHPLTSPKIIQIRCPRGGCVRVCACACVCVCVWGDNYSVGIESLRPQFPSYHAGSSLMSVNFNTDVIQLRSGRKVPGSSPRSGNRETNAVWRIDAKLKKCFCFFSLTASSLGYEKETLPESRKDQF